MKLAFFIDSLFRGAGTERIATSVANALCKKGYEVEFVVFSESVDSYFKVDSQIEISSLRSNFFQKKRTIGKLRDYLRKYKPEYLICVAVQMSVIGIPACIGLPTKVITWEHFQLHASSSIKGYIMRLFSAVLSYKHIVLTQSDRVDYPYLFRNKVIAIPNFPVINPTSLAKLDSNIVLAVGRLEKQKGFDLLLEAWTKVVQQNKQWKLCIVGSGMEKNSLEKLMEERCLNSFVSLVPATKNIAKYYEQATLLVVSSRFEGLSMVLLEAKSFGLPLVAFACPHGPKEIIRNGIDGVLVSNGNKEELASSLLMLMGNRKQLKEMGREAYTDYQQRWCERVIIEEWVKILK